MIQALDQSVVTQAQEIAPVALTIAPVMAAVVMIIMTMKKEMKMTMVNKRKVMKNSFL